MAEAALQNLSSNPAVRRLMQAAPAWLNLVLVAVLGYSLAALIWVFIPVPESPQPPRQSGGAYASGNTSQVVYYGDRIANMHLFGRADQPKQNNNQPINNAPVSKLDLVLRGVLAHNPQEKALAIISRGRGAEEVYAVGDTLPGNAELVEVHSDRVIISYQGRYETILLEEGQNLNIASTAPVPRSVPRSTPGGNVPRVSPQRASQLRQEFLANPSKVLSLVNLKQERQGGQLRGYKVTPKGDPALFHEIGLQSGDVITSVNGIPMSNQRALSKLRNAERYDVTVLRNGIEVPISLSFQ